MFSATNTSLKQSELAFDALGNPVRREILALLAKLPRSVGELAVHFPISRPAVSRHLALLEHAGFVEYVEDGTSNIYRLRSAGFDATRIWLEGFWDDAEARLKMLAKNLTERPVQK